MTDIFDWLKEQDPRIQRISIHEFFDCDDWVIVGQIYHDKPKPRIWVRVTLSPELLADESTLREWCLMVFSDTADLYRRDHMITTALGSAVWAAIFCVAFCAALSWVPGMLVALIVAVGLAVAYHARGGE
jgi:hypothetical protein